MHTYICVCALHTITCRLSSWVLHIVHTFRSHNYQLVTAVYNSYGYSYIQQIKPQNGSHENINKVHTKLYLLFVALCLLLVLGRR